MWQDQKENKYTALKPENSIKQDPLCRVLKFYQAPESPGELRTETA